MKHLKINNKKPVCAEDWPRAGGSRAAAGEVVGTQGLAEKEQQDDVHPPEKQLLLHLDLKVYI